MSPIRSSGRGPGPAATSTPSGAGRLRYLRRVVVAGPPLLLALVQAAAGSPGSWASAVRQDLRFLFDSIQLQPRGSQAAGLPDPEVDPLAWSAFIAGSKGSWSNVIAKHVIGVPAASSEQGGPGRPCVGSTIDFPCPDFARAFGPSDS